MITTLVGNVPKVADGGYGTKVIGALNRWQQQQLSDEGLEQVFQEVTRGVIAEQERIGLDLLSDGQIRWEDLVTPLARKLQGFEINGLERFFDNNTYYRRPILTKTPVRRQPVFLSDYLFARGCTSKPVKVILPGPYSMVTLSEDRYYKNPKPFLRSIAEILNEEAQTLAKAGARFIQFDEPALSFGPPAWLNGGRAGKPPIKDVMEALTIAADSVKATLAVSTYFGALSPEILRALQRLPVDVIGVDVASDPKMLSVVKRVKWTKALALGCLDARNTKLESITELHVLFDFASKLVPLDRVYVNPSCGLEFLPYEQARQKLRRLVEAVRQYRPASSRTGSSRRSARASSKTRSTRRAGSLARSRA